MSTIDPDIQAAIDASKADTDKKIGAVEKKVDKGFEDVTKSLKELIAASKTPPTTDEDEADDATDEVCEDGKWQCPICTDARCFNTKASLQGHWRSKHAKIEGPLPDDIEAVGSKPTKTKSKSTSKPTPKKAATPPVREDEEEAGPITAAIKWFRNRNKES